MSYGSAEELYDLGIALDRVETEHSLSNEGTATERFARIMDHLAQDGIQCSHIRRRRPILADSLPWRMGEAD